MPSPMIKATLAATALACTSNVLAQYLDAYVNELPFTFDPAKFIRFALVALLTAPPNYMWQALLERTFPAYAPKAGPASSSPPSTSTGKTGGGGGGGDYFNDVEKQAGGSNKDSDDLAPAPTTKKLNLRNTMTKWFIDCITLGALFNTVAFFLLMGVLKGQDLAQISGNIRTETIPVIIAGYKIWPFASIISFSFIPVERRIVFLNFVGLLWGIYMSFVATRV